MKTIDLASGTDTGKQRQDNQDRLIAVKLWTDHQALAGVIDGVGGYEGGDIAATIAKESIEYYMSSPKGDVLSMLKEAVVLANNQVIEQKTNDPGLAGMCCVLTVFVADAKKQVVHYVHVGDTRLYRFRDGSIEKITNDHSLVGVREDAGELSEAEAMQHPRRNVILRQVGTETHRIDDPDFLEYGETGFQPGDILLVCSDGLSDMITKEQITSFLNKKLSLSTAIPGLIALANEAGGKDNISVVLAKNLSKVKPAQADKINTVPVPATVEIEAPGTVQTPKKNLTTILLIALILMLLALAGIWLMQTRPGTTSVAPVVRTDTGATMPDSSQPPDTIRLKNTIELTKMGHITGSRSSTTVLVPDSAFTTGAAVKIISNQTGETGLDTIYLKDLLIQGFETGIWVEGNSILSMDNVTFRNVAHPVSYSNKDSTKTKYLRFQ